MTRTRPWEVHYPPGLDWGAPIAQGALNELLDRAVSTCSGRPAIYFRGRAISYGELGRQVERLARGLAALGVRAGEAVALLLPNTPAHPISFFAVAGWAPGSCI